LRLLSNQAPWQHTTYCWQFLDLSKQSYDFKEDQTAMILHLAPIAPKDVKEL